MAAYVVGPAAALGYAVVVRARSDRTRPLRRALLALAGGTVVGILACVLHALATQSQLVVGQVLLTAYFAAGLIQLIGWGDALLVAGVRAAFGLRRYGGRWFGLRATAAAAVRSAVVLCVGVPYVIAAGFTYCPHVDSRRTPMTARKWAYVDVAFRATDGTRITGWWIPAAAPQPTPASPGRTILLCPGSLDDMASYLQLVRRLRPDGWNVLVIRFRGRGDSGGPFASFGDLEQRDVLGAVNWLRAEHPAACGRVAGLGVDSGAAALLAASAHPSPAGRTNDAVAVYAAYDSLDHYVAEAAPPLLPGPMTWLVRRVGLPMAGVQVGADLAHFSPADCARRLAPRPLLVVHSLGDELVPFAAGEAVFNAAAEPKGSYWVVGSPDEKTTFHEMSLKDAGAAGAVREFLNGARAEI